jgi:YgiT-type zinc finger domain-containing protein
MRIRIRGIAPFIGAKRADLDLLASKSIRPGKVMCWLLRKREMKNCPACGAPSLVHANHDMPYTYKGQETVIPAVAGHRCSNCSEVTLDREVVDRYSSLVGQFQAKVDGEQAG